MKETKNLRRRLSLAIVICASITLFTRAAVQPGVERWPIKTSLSAQADVTHPKVVGFIDLLGLEDAPGVTKNDARFQSALIPGFDNPLKLKEGDIVSVSGWLHLVAGESDGDFHIQMSGSQSSGNRCLIVESPKPDPAFVSDPTVTALSTKVRKFIMDKVLLGQTPSSSGTVVEPVYVTVSGQLFYDDSHVGDAPRGKKGMKAATLWELHPLTDIKLATP
jgi:hypothetical protein